MVETEQAVRDRRKDAEILAWEILKSDLESMGFPEDKEDQELFLLMEELVVENLERLGVDRE